VRILIGIAHSSLRLYLNPFASMLIDTTFSNDNVKIPQECRFVSLLWRET
jgi:hypothetical protein